MAPSPDNNQPWRFVVGDDELAVHLDRQACLPSDVDHMFDLIALGAAIENSVLAAGTHGYSADIAYLVDRRVPESTDRYYPVARIRFAEGGQESPLARWIPERATCRRPYDVQPIESQKLAAITDAASGMVSAVFPPTRSVSEDDSRRRLANASGWYDAESAPSCELEWIQDGSAIKELSKLVAKADGLRFRYRAFHEELYRQLRFTSAEAEASRDGLDVRTFELPRPAVWALRWLRSWRRMRALHLCGLGGLLTAPSARLVRQSAAIGVLTTSAVGRASDASRATPAATDYLDSGRALQRAWLTATSLGLSVHPLGSLPIFLAQLRRIESHPADLAHLPPLNVVELKRLRDALGAIVPQPPIVRSQCCSGWAAQRLLRHGRCVERSKAALPPPANNSNGDHALEHRHLAQ